MPKVVITHAVVDIERWLSGKSERAAAIASGSGSNVTDYVAQDGSNNIAITADVQDLDALQAMLASPSPEVAARMEAHGVVPPISACGLPGAALAPLVALSVVSYCEIGAERAVTVQLSAASAVERDTCDASLP